MERGLKYSMSVNSMMKSILLLRKEDQINSKIAVKNFYRIFGAISSEEILGLISKLITIRMSMLVSKLHPQDMVMLEPT
jgi:hypothetical protein